MSEVDKRGRKTPFTILNSELRRKVETAGTHNNEVWDFLNGVPRENSSGMARKNGPSISVQFFKRKDSDNDSILSLGDAKINPILGSRRLSRPQPTQEFTTPGSGFRIKTKSSSDLLQTFPSHNGSDAKKNNFLKTDVYQGSDFKNL